MSYAGGRFEQVKEIFERPEDGLTKRQRRALLYEAKEQRPAPSSIPRV